LPRPRWTLVKHAGQNIFIRGNRLA
jgi:hypothetical protein